VTVTLNGVPTTTTVTLPGGSLLGRSVPLGGTVNDWAHHRPTVASSQLSSEVAAHFLTDGNPRTRWAAAPGAHHWVRVDLQDLRLLDQVEVGWDTTRPFSVELSTDGHTWTTVYSTKRGTKGVSTVRFEPTFARFVRLAGTGPGFSAWKLEATGPTDLAIGATATASSSASTLPPANAIDGLQGTRWGSSYSDPQHITVDLGTDRSLSWIVLRWEAASAKAYTVDISPDGSTWTTAYATTSGTGGVVTIPVTGSGRYVRMNGTARNTVYGYSLWEIEVYAR
jgi:chondroitin AC lyase